MASGKGSRAAAAVAASSLGVIWGGGGERGCGRPRADRPSPQAAPPWARETPTSLRESCPCTPSPSTPARKEHKKKHLTPQSTLSPEHSKKCSERWKTVSAKEKWKFEDMAESDKAHCDREMKNYIPPKGGDKRGKKKGPRVPKRPPSSLFLFCSEHCPKKK